MSSINLTQIEAQQRAELISNCHYDITLDVTSAPTEQPTFASTTDIRFTSGQGETFLDLRAASVREVILDGTPIDDAPAAYTPEHGIALSLTAGEHTLRVVADCEYSRTGQGLHRFTDPADQETYLYTQFETADAKRVFACFDQPDIKATYTMTVTTPAGWKVVSNPAMVEDTTTNIHRGEVNYLLSTYLVAFCIGPYHEVRDSWSGRLTHHPETPSDQPTELTVPFGIYCRKSLAHALDAEQIFRETKQGFDYYHEHFGMAYPFVKYDQVFCPEYNMGAMENAGCVTFRDEYVFTSKVTRRMYERRCDTILHELAHMWFGDLVTMQWWGDLWLNESFATWSAAMSQAEATEFDTAWVTFANVEKSWAYAQDQLPSTHPIVASAKDIETVEQNFDGITYAKGASVFKQLQAYVGRDSFFAGVRSHFANHAFANATFEDLLGALAQASGRDLSGWAQQWLTTTGINTLRPTFTIQNGVYTDFAVEQTGAQPGAGELRTHRIAVGLYSLVDGQVKRTKRVELDIEGARTAVPELVEFPAADLVLVNDDDLTYALMELDDHSLEFVLDNIANIADPMARALCWSSCWQMTRSGQMRARDFVRLVAEGARTESEIFVLEALLGQASRALNSFADPQWAESTGRALLSDALLEAARAAAPGSDQQLAFVQSLSAQVMGDDAAELMQQIVRGESTLDGLEIDFDLQWRALVALIARGDVSDPSAAIADLRAKDTSASGRNWAWVAEAAVNTAENKQAMFDAIVQRGSQMSNLELRHKGQGLTWAGSASNLMPLTAQFFEAAPGIWKEFTSEVALRTLEEIYPGWDISEEAIALADGVLAGDHSDGFKRVLSEGQDNVRRALRNRAVDAG